MKIRIFSFVSFLLLLCPLCAQDEETGDCAHVEAASAVQSDEDLTWTFTVTVSSTETGWDKYADAWEVRSGDVVLGTRVLLHPHVNEQPFTRSLPRVVVPDDVDVVLIAARDSQLGFCGKQLLLELESGTTTPVTVAPTSSGGAVDDSLPTQQPQAEPSMLSSEAPTSSEAPSSSPSVSPSPTTLVDGASDAPEVLTNVTSSAFGAPTSLFVLVHVLRILLVTLAFRI